MLQWFKSKKNSEAIDVILNQLEQLSYILTDQIEKRLEEKWYTMYIGSTFHYWVPYKQVEIFDKNNVVIYSISGYTYDVIKNLNDKCYELKKLRKKRWPYKVRKKKDV